jgi:C-terminal peptidase prc
MKILLLIVVLFFTSCVSIEYKNSINTTISTINKYYIKDIKISKIDKNIETKKEFYKQINNIFGQLDKYSYFVLHNNKTKKYSLKYNVFKQRLYLKVPYFYFGVTNELKKIIFSYKDLKEIVLDLSGNPGGVFKEAIGVVNIFVDSGFIVQITKKDKFNKKRYYATKSNTTVSLPLYIIIDNNSASSSEVVAGALQDLKRAVIVGRKSYGKNKMQKFFYIDKDHKKMIKITVAKYELAKKRVNNKIVPDIENLPLCK